MARRKASQAARDIAYGRQGGRVVPASTHSTSHPSCDLCGGPMTLGQRWAHLVCAERAGQEHPQQVRPSRSNR